MKKIFLSVCLAAVCSAGFAQVKTDAEIADPKNKPKAGAVKPGFGAFREGATSVNPP